MIALSDSNFALLTEFFTTLDSVDAMLQKGKEPDFGLLVQASIQLWRFKNGWSVAIERRLSRRDSLPPTIAVGKAGTNPHSRYFYLIKEGGNRWAVYEPYRNWALMTRSKGNLRGTVHLEQGIVISDYLLDITVMFPFLDYAP